MNYPNLPMANSNPSNSCAGVRVSTVETELLASPIKQLASLVKQLAYEPNCCVE